MDHFFSGGSSGDGINPILWFTLGLVIFGGLQTWVAIVLMWIEKRREKHLRTIYLDLFPKNESGPMFEFSNASPSGLHIQTITYIFQRIATGERLPPDTGNLALTIKPWGFSPINFRESIRRALDKFREPDKPALETNELFICWVTVGFYTYGKTEERNFEFEMKYRPGASLFGPKGFFSVS